MILGGLARAALHVFLAVAPGRLQARIGLLVGGRHHLVDGPAGVLVIEELGRRGALRLALLGVALEVVGQRGEADREIVAVAQPHAQCAIGGEGQVAELIGRALRRIALLAAEEHRERVARGVPAARLLHVLLAAAVARQLPDDVVLIGAVARAHDLATLRIEVSELLARSLHLRIEVDAARCAPERLGEQELVPAVVSLDLGLGHPIGALGLAHLAFDAGQQFAALVGALRLAHQPLLELETEIAHAVARIAGRTPAFGRGAAAGPADTGLADTGPRAADRPAPAARGAAAVATRATNPSPEPARRRTARKSAATAQPASTNARAPRDFLLFIAVDNLRPRLGCWCRYARIVPLELCGCCDGGSMYGTQLQRPRIDLTGLGKPPIRRHDQDADTRRKPAVRHYCNELATELARGRFFAPPVTEKRPASGEGTRDAHALQHADAPEGGIPADRPGKRAHVRVRADGLRLRPHRQCAARHRLRRAVPAAAAPLRGRARHLRAQHHRRRRQDQCAGG